LGAAVPALLREMLDESSLLDWFQTKLLLHAIGPAAYDDVLASLETAHDEGARRRAGAASSGLAPAVPESAAIGHPVRVLGNVRPHPGVPGRHNPIEALVPLVADPDQDVAERDQWVLPMLGDAVLDRSGGYSATARENCGRLSSRC
jgi:hypothetical protein